MGIVDRGNPIYVNWNIEVRDERRLENIAADFEHLR